MKILNIIGLAISAGLLYAVPAQAKLVCVQVTPVYLSCSNDRDITVEGRIDAGSGVTVTDPDVPSDTGTNGNPDDPGDPGDTGGKDNKGHGNGDEGDAKGKDGHDSDNPGNDGGGKGNGKNK